MLKEIREQYIEGQICKNEYITKQYNNHRLLLEYSDFIKGSQIENIVINQQGTVVETTDGIKLFVKKDDERTMPIEMINFGDYEKEEWEKVLKLLQRKKIQTILDIGGNIGYIALLLERYLSDTEIHTFEPIKETYEIMTKNIEINKSNIVAHNIGLSDTEGILDYYYYKEGSGNTSLMNLSGRESVEIISAQVSTVDKFIEEEHLHNVDFIKIDVEGAEFSVLKGAKELLIRNKPIIFVELLRKWSAPFGYKPQDVVEYLSDFGYKCYVLDDMEIRQIKRIDENTLETNFLFLQ